MAGQEALEHDPDGLTLVGIEVDGGLESQPQRLVLGKAIALAEDQRVGADGQGDGQLAEDSDGRLVGAGLVALELGDVDAHSLGQRRLRQAPSTPQLGQVLGELHDGNDSGLGTGHGGNNVYKLDNTMVQMKSRPVPDSVVPLDVEPDADDATLLGAVLGHWHERLVESPDASSMLARLGATVTVAEEVGIGWSDRTLGLRLPDRRWKAGAVLRQRLTELEMLRPSGHEAFRGCLVVPVTDAGGAVVGLLGRRTDGSTTPVWAGGLPGGIFNDQPVSSSPLLVVGSVPEALAVLATGRRAVVAPGRPNGFLRADLIALAKRGQPLVVLGRGNGDVAERLAALGAPVSVAAPDVVIGRALASAKDPTGALMALVWQARPVEVPGAVLADEVPIPTGPPAEVSTTELIGSQPAAAPTPTPSGPVATDARSKIELTEGKDEVFVRFAARSWRIRGAGKEANRTTDALRVALSVTDLASGRFHLDTLDLYQARLRAGFLTAAVTELHVDAATLRAELAEVIGAAEEARDRAAEPVAPVVPEMTEAEREEALALLYDPQLLDRVAADLSGLGVVGEETNLLVAYLATVSRLGERPFGVLVQSSSAAGKSTLTDAVCSLVPTEDLVSVSALTGQALYYLSGGDLAHKVLSVAEEQGAVRAAYALKLLVSDGKLAIASTGKDRSTGRLTTRSYEVAGPVALVMTTTAAVIDPELENRLVVVGVDEGADQTQAILAAQRRAATLEGLVARGERDRLRRLHRNAQRLLRPFPVVVPDLDGDFPATATRHRRDHQKLLSIVAAVTLLHQHQREKKTVELDGVTLTYLEATPADVAAGLALARAVLARTTDDLAPQARRLLDAMVEHASTRATIEGCQPHEVGVTRRELRQLLGWSEKAVRAATDRLVTLDYLVSAGGGRGRCRTYSMVDGGWPLEGGVGPSDGPVGPPGGRTEGDSHTGGTSGFAPLARLGESLMPGSTDVGEGLVGQGGDLMAAGAG